MARSFNGTTDQINCGTQTLLLPAAITMSIWANHGTLSNAYNQLLGSVTASIGCHILVKSTGGVAYYYTCSSTGANIDPGAATLSASTWYHIAASYSNTGSTLKTYVNGVSDGTASGSGTIQTGSSTMGIGYDPSVASRNFPGSLADAAVWNVQLTDLEIAGLAKGLRPSSIRLNALIGWWPLDGLQSPEPDISGNLNNGTLTGTAKAFGPPFMPFTPRWPQTTLVSAPASTTVFRRTLSPRGTRAGSRQVHAT